MNSSLEKVYDEVRDLSRLLAPTLLLAAIFWVYVLPRYPVGNPYSAAVFHFWGVAVVILIPVSIVANRENTPLRWNWRFALLAPLTSRWKRSSFSKRTSHECFCSQQERGRKTVLAI